MSQNFSRIEALHREIEVARRELVALLKEEARALVPDVELSGPSGPISLSGLFGGREELVLSFHMGKGSPYCTLWADAASGVLPYLESVASFALLSPDLPEEQLLLAKERGWRFQMASHAGTAFAEEMGFAGRDEDGSVSYWPGVATFRKTPEGIERVAVSYYRPGDPFCSLQHFFALLHSEGRAFSPRGGS